MTMRSFLLALAAAAHLGGAAFAGSDGAPAPGSGFETRLLSGAGSEMASLDPDLAIDELNELARYALEIGRPDIFRTVMVSQVDPHWGALNDSRTALNMIAWLPDTGEFLPSRIAAARIALGTGDLADLETQRLWRDLRARVERVGEADLLHELALAMIAAGEDAMVIETVERFHAGDRARLDTYAHLLGAMPATGRPEAAAALVAAVRSLAADAEIASRSATDITHALWSAGYHDEALGILEAEPDPLERLRTRFRLLAEMPQEDQSGS